MLLIGIMNMLYSSYGLHIIESQKNGKWSQGRYYLITICCLFRGVRRDILSRTLLCYLLLEKCSVKTVSQVPDFFHTDVAALTFGEKRTVRFTHLRHAGENGLEFHTSLIHNSLSAASSKPNLTARTCVQKPSFKLSALWRDSLAAAT